MGNIVAITSVINAIATVHFNVRMDEVRKPRKLPRQRVAERNKTQAPVFTPTHRKADSATKTRIGSESGVPSRLPVSRQLASDTSATVRRHSSSH